MQPESQNILLRMVLWIIHLWVRLPIRPPLLRHLNAVRHTVDLVPVFRGRQMRLAPPPFLPRGPRRDREKLRKPRLAGNLFFFQRECAAGRAAEAAVHRECRCRRSSSGVYLHRSMLRSDYLRLGGFDQL